jgi:hypothetical protein
MLDGWTAMTMNRRHLLGAVGIGIVGVPAIASAARPAGNPVVPGWYADPELHIFEGRY